MIGLTNLEINQKLHNKVNLKLKKLVVPGSDSKIISKKTAVEIKEEIENVLNPYFE